MDRGRPLSAVWVNIASQGNTMEVLGGIAPRPVSSANALPPALADRREGERSPFAGAFGLAGLADYGRQGRAAANADARGDASPGAGAEAQGGNNGEAGASSRTAIADSVQLSPEAQQQLRELRQRDAEVRAHEQAHVAAGGAHVVGGPSYVYQQGPDGKQYAIGGEVSIDTAPVAGDPEATAEKARQVRRAALAPAQPSAADRQVAAEASTTEAEARQEERVEEREEREGREGSSRTDSRAEGPAGADVWAADPAAAGDAVAEAGQARRADRNLATQRAEQQQADDARQQQYELESARRESEGLAMQRAAWAYAAMSQRGIMPTTLAPGGTGISLLV